MTLTARATSNVVCWPFWPSATLRHARSSGATHRKHSALDSASAWPHPKNPERIHDPVYLVGATPHSRELGGGDETVRGPDVEKAALLEPHAVDVEPGPERGRDHRAHRPLRRAVAGAGPGD